MYGAAGVEYEQAAEEAIEKYTRMGFDKLPICMAKTQYSFRWGARGWGSGGGWVARHWLFDRGCVNSSGMCALARLRTLVENAGRQGGQSLVWPPWMYQPLLIFVTVQVSLFSLAWK